MQRSKAAVSVEVKQVIAALCKLLAATGLHAVPAPETFRRAKFGGEVEVVRSSLLTVSCRQMLTSLVNIMRICWYIIVKEVRLGLYCILVMPVY